ncbi:MAG: nucleoside-diphosphate sugar epimerase/dehydratase [Candidatus Pseudoruminococcus sp.]|uniref:polysaccharide biosynthesis protein n=1 Tax=Candidatus Pseudoruminococcus sp. TaxID=3101048 RepID=UPI002A79852C|nr:polysaccharide biosynthesis protein [Ruminococcus sp.]MDY2782142.1 nucleoside-diphosphate sugar epimerase/dehydratase [Candidatus Pseudoruminococcus sp.]
MNKLYKKLKTHRKLLLFLCDFCLWNVSYYISFVVNKSSFVLKGWEEPFMWGLLFINVIFTAVFLCFKLYDKMWRYADIEDFFYAAIASLTANLVFMSFTMIIGTDENRLNYGARIYIIMSLLSTFLTFIFRLVYRLNKIIERKNTSNKNRRRLMIVGGGEGAATVLSELAKSPENEYVPICLVDDDPEKIGRRIGGVKIEGSTYDIPEICEREDIEVILFTISQINLADKKRILDICAKTHLEVKIIPNVYGLIKDGASVTSKIRQVEVEDLLGREPVVFDTEKYGAYITGQTVLVTGGGGSIGSELCRQIAKLSPKKLIILDIYENNAYEIQQELIRQYHKKLNLDTQIASVRDKRKLDYLFSQNKIDVIFHAAAHKHVPLMETTPEEAVKNNVFGTLNLVLLADKYHVKKFVQISTDKAVNPTNIMGATKRICEMIVQTMDKKSETKFVAVRFGNVLGSNGSVIPLFKEQIQEGGPVTVTHPDIIRFFMTIPEAVSLVLTAGGLAKGGEIFILDMGEPVKILTLAENLIRLSGFKPYEDIPIEFTGLRPGEKLYEEILLNEEGMKKTANKKIFIGKPIELDVEKFNEKLVELKKAALKNDKNGIDKLISEIVPTFNHKKN